MQENQEIILTIGLPASGKTTWALQFIKDNPEYYNVNRDDIRLMLQGRGRYNKFTKTREQLVSNIQFNTADFILEDGKSLIVSDTNLNPMVQQKWKDFAKSRNVPIVEKLFTDIPLGVILERDKLREFPVTGNIITGMFEKYQSTYWPKPAFDTSLPNAIIVDVDGTIAHMHNRRPYQWDKVIEDFPKMDIINIVNSLHQNGVTVIICSGRDGVAYEDTKFWLDEHNVEYDHFYIRGTGDSRKDYVIKEEIYDEHIKGKYNIVSVFDDRDQVVWLWRHLGLTCLQVNYGNF